MAEIELSGRKITAKTLTVQQVRELLDAIQQQAAEKKTLLQLDVVDLLFDDDVPAIAVAKSSGLSLKELAGPHDPQQVKELIDEVRAANPFFVGMMERLVGAGKSAVAAPPETLSPQSAS